MFRVSRLTDYGVVLLSYLARRDGSLMPSSARDLAMASGLPQPTVSKLLKIMAKHELIRAKRGVLGGYELNQDLRSISLLKFIEMLEGPTGLTDCVAKPNIKCQIDDVCPQRNTWQVVHQKVAKVLDEVSIYDLVVPKRMTTLSPLGVR